MIPMTKQGMEIFYGAEFMDMLKSIPRAPNAAQVSQVLADCNQVAAEEKAAKISIHRVIMQVELLLDLCDGDSSGILEDCLSKLNAEAKHIDRIMDEAQDAYESVALRQSEGAQGI